MSNTLRHQALDLSGVRDWDSFHSIFSQSLGFPDYYGRNMDAWIDCIGMLDDPARDSERPATALRLAEGELLSLELTGVAYFKSRCPEIYEALLECAAFVNYRRTSKGRS